MVSYSNENIKLYNGDCLQVMDILIESGVKVDCIITDLPYEKTKNSWDIIVPFAPMWERINKLIKDNGAICLFGQDKFTAKLMLSNEKMHRYNLIWNKVLPTGFLNANRMPMRVHEDICIFYKKLPKYFPQKTKGKPNNSKGKPKTCENNNYGDFEFVDNREKLGDMKHPTSIISFSKPHPSICKHPTEKSVDMIKWLINSYTQDGELILDFTMGSGTTGQAVVEVGGNRAFIGIELKEEYFNISKTRIEETINNYRKVEL